MHLQKCYFSHIGFGDCIHLSHRHTPFLYKRNRVSCPNIPFPQIFFFHTGNQITEWLKNCFPDMYTTRLTYPSVDVNLHIICRIYIYIWNYDCRVFRNIILFLVVFCFDMLLQVTHTRKESNPAELIVFSLPVYFY